MIFISDFQSRFSKTLQSDIFLSTAEKLLNCIHMLIPKTVPKLLFLTYFFLLLLLILLCLQFTLSGHHCILKLEKYIDVTAKYISFILQLY